MSAALLGETFDIHGGGIDLVFPHHENEIAQSRCAFHSKVMANFWMHNGFLQVEGEKMSKSRGNFVTIHELLAEWPGEVLRFNMLRTHYRQPIDWTLKGLEETTTIINSWADALPSHYLTAENREAKISQEVLEALSDDLNTPKAIAAMHGLAHASKRGDSKAADGLAAAADMLGLQRAKWNAKFDQFMYRSAVDDEFSGRVDELIAKRAAARNAKNFTESDRIRDELAKMGVVLKDSKDGTTWEVAR
jgi:cysteinyl-tRNA synthetase